jgi:hypothetical protein
MLFAASVNIWRFSTMKLKTSQGWHAFLHNHAPDIAAMDLFIVPIIGLKLL